MMKISIFPKYWKDLIFTPACLYGILALSLLPAVYLFWYNKEKAGAISTLSVKIESLHKKSLLNKMKAEKEEKILLQP